MKRIVGIGAVILICIALGLSVEGAAEDMLSLLG